MSREMIEGIQGIHIGELMYFQDGVLIIFLDSFEKIYKYVHDQLKKKQNLDQISRLGLMLNGENYTMWSIRHQLMSDGLINNLHDEIKFLNLINLRFRKSSQAYHYRFRIFEALPKSEYNLKNELEYLEQFFEAHSRNYHGWSYLVRLRDFYLQIGDFLFMYTEMNEFALKMIYRNLKDHSSLHFYLMLQKQFLSQDKNNQFSQKFKEDLQKMLDSLKETYKNLYAFEITNNQTSMEAIKNFEIQLKKLFHK